jgi:hypothetical protein
VPPSSGRFSVTSYEGHGPGITDDLHAGARKSQPRRKRTESAFGAADHQYQPLT